MTALGPWTPPFTVAVAVSGGADSLALTLLVDRWCRQAGGTVRAVTVDHGLRPESAAEAAQVGQWLAVHGINHHILRWDGAKPQANLQAEARQARYGLLAAWARQHGIAAVLLAHHQDDQAETLLLRLGRGSGVDGLSAMAAERHQDGVRWLRPLLDVPKAALQAVLEQYGQDWVRDPSNRNPDYQRVRWRQLLPTLAAEGLTPQRLAQTATRLQRARQALEQMTDTVAAACVTADPMGYVRFSPLSHWSCPDEIALRLLSRMLRQVSGAVYPPRLEGVERLWLRLQTQTHGDATLSGCRVVWTDDGGLVAREAARMAPPCLLRPGISTVWDGRFICRVSADLPDGAVLGGLGGFGRRRLEKLRLSVPLPPAVVRPTLPALWGQDGTLRAVPHLGYGPPLPISPCTLGTADLL